MYWGYTLGVFPRCRGTDISNLALVVLDLERNEFGN